MHADACVDACGLACPMPLLKARLALNDLPAGAVLKVLATDGGALRDIPKFAALAGHELLSVEERDDSVLVFLLRKAG